MGWIRDLAASFSRSTVSERIEPRAAIQSSGPGLTITTAEDLEAALRGGAESMSGVAVTPESAMKVGAVFACVRIITSAVATLPIDVRERVSDEVRKSATDHAVYRLLKRKPNDWQTPSQFKRMMEAHKLLRGNAYAQIVWSMGRPIALIPLNPDRVKVVQRDDYSLEYIYSRVKGGQVTFGQSDIFHLVGLTLDGVRGVTPITYARETIGTSIAMERHGGNVFRNGTQVGNVFKMPPGAALSDPAYARLKASLEAYRADGESAGGIMLLEEGMDIGNMSMTQQDAQWVEGRKLSRSDICMFFGVPPTMIGDNTGSDSNWGTGLEQKSQGFITFTLEDHLTTWEETCERDLLTVKDDKIYVRFNRAALVKGDLKARKEYYAAARQWGWMNPDEIRALEDMNPRKDGKGGEFAEPPNTNGAAQKSEETSDDPAKPA